MFGNIVKFFFAATENNNIIHVTEIVFHPLFFFDPVIERGQIEIAAILGKIRVRCCVKPESVVIDDFCVWQHTDIQEVSENIGE